MRNSRALATARSISTGAFMKSACFHLNLNRSGTRKEELLLAPEILQKSRILRQFMYNMDEIESMELMLKNMKATKNNHEFFDMMRRGG